MWKALCVCRENLTQWEQIVQGEDTSAWASTEEAELSETSDSGPVKVDNWICGTCPTAPPTPCQRHWTSCGQSHFLQRQEEAQRAGGEGCIQKNKQNIMLPQWVTEAYTLMTSGSLVDGWDSSPLQQSGRHHWQYFSLGGYFCIYSFRLFFSFFHGLTFEEALNTNPSYDLVGWLVTIRWFV